MPPAGRGTIPTDGCRRPPSCLRGEPLGSTEEKIFLRSAPPQAALDGRLPEAALLRVRFLVPMLPLGISSRTTNQPSPSGPINHVPPSRHGTQSPAARELRRAADHLSSDRHKHRVSEMRDAPISSQINVGTVGMRANEAHTMGRLSRHAIPIRISAKHIAGLRSAIASGDGRACPRRVVICWDYTAPR